MEIYLLLGGNIGPVRENLRRAEELIAVRVGRVVRASRVYRSPAWGFESPDPFYNVALAVETALAPDVAMRTLLQIEQELGRRRGAASETPPAAPQPDAACGHPTSAAPQAVSQAAPSAAPQAVCPQAVCPSAVCPQASAVPQAAPSAVCPQAAPQTVPAAQAAADAAPSKTYASRPIDIDILFFGTLVLDTPLLTVPHPRLPQRRFALLPLCDIAPALVHPVLHQTVTDLLAACPDTAEVVPVP